MKKISFMILLIMMCLMLAFSGCAQNGTPDSTPETSEPSGEPGELATPSEETAAAVQITEDMAGRPLSLPETVDRVYGSNNNSTILLYTLAPEKMLGWNLEFSDKAKQYMMEECASLPVLGNMYGSGKKADAEEILKYEPDIVLLANTKINDTVKKDADELQELLGVPVVVIEANVGNYDKAYEFLGALLGEEEKAAELAGYYEEIYAEVTEKSAGIAEEDKVSVYYARLDDGLTTEFAGSPNAELIELIGAVNIAESAGKETGGEVTIEQVLAWDPDLILVGNVGANESLAYQAITTDEIWGSLSAVQQGAVYGVPRFPFNWFDRPPSVNRIIGMKWLGNLLYPDVYDFGTEDVKSFFKLFYGCTLSDEQAAELIG